MQKQCHGHIIDLKSYNKGEQTLTCCYIRKIELVLTPEEEVRQALLKFIYEHSNINTTLFITRVEYQHLDIAFYSKTPFDDFQPSLAPFIIVETKRDHVNLLDFGSQIKRYLKINNCRTGFLFHSHSIYLLSEINGHIPVKIDINEFLAKFELSHVNFTDDCLLFEKARNGDFECFKQLAKKYGKNSKIAFITKDSIAPIVGFLFDFSNDYIFFDYCGVKATAKKPKISINKFLKLKYIKE
ncbi:MAG: hypothetical protein ACXVED_14630 [Bacteroidia bacterium]